MTNFGMFMTTVQIPVPVHAPDHPVKVDSKSGVAVRVTTVPGMKLVLQIMPQSML
jgi:hypothetical protein